LAGFDLQIHFVFAAKRVMIAGGASKPLACACFKGASHTWRSAKALLKSAALAEPLTKAAS